MPLWPSCAALVRATSLLDVASMRAAASGIQAT
jgi:hypothetical protein